MIHDVDHTVIYSENPLDPSDCIEEKTTTCFECLRKKIGEPDHKQGNLSIWRVADTKFIYPSDHGEKGLWYRKCETIGKYYGYEAEIFNHRISGAEEIFIRDDTKLALYSGYTITIEARDHETIYLQPGAYIGYHPRPWVGVD